MVKTMYKKWMKGKTNIRYTKNMYSEVKLLQRVIDLNRGDLSAKDIDEEKI